MLTPIPNPGSVESLMAWFTRVSNSCSMARIVHDLLSSLVKSEQGVEELELVGMLHTPNS